MEGLKNKLLEAAAMGKAIVASGRALTGLTGDPPVRHAATPVEWVEAIDELLTDDHLRLALGLAVRDRVVAHHAWSTAARVARDGLVSNP